MPCCSIATRLAQNAPTGRRKPKPIGAFYSTYFTLQNGAVLPRG
jgi:hypothetical protein